MLELGKKGIYSVDKLAPIADSFMKWFRQTSECSNTQREASDSLKKHIFFKQLNLMNEWPMKGSFQLIICRNVLIYFDKQTQEKLIRRFYDYLEPDGCLILGHSESLGDNKGLFKNLGKTIFRKLGR